MPRVFTWFHNMKGKKINCSPSSIHFLFKCVLSLLILLRFGDETLTRFGSQWEMSSAEVLFIQSHWDTPQTLPLCLADQTSPGAGLGGLPVGSWIGLLSCRVPSGVSHMLYVWSCAAGWKVHMYLASPWGTEGRGVRVQQTIQCCTTRSGLFGSRAVLI